MTPTINRSSGNFSCGCNTKHPAKQAYDSRFRDRVVHTNLDLILIGLVLALFHAVHAYANEAAATVEETASSAGEVHQATGETEEEILLEEQTDVYAVLYPWYDNLVLNHFNFCLCLVFVSKWHSSSSQGLSRLSACLHITSCPATFMPSHTQLLCSSLASSSDIQFRELQ